MWNLSLLRRCVLLTLSLLSACAAGGVPADAPSAAGRAYGAFLNARFAESQFALGEAARYYRAASAADPADRVLRQQAFISSLMAGDPAAQGLAAAVPGDPIAELFLIGEAANHGAWQAAIARINALPREGLTQILSPLLLAWAEQGAGNTDAALAALKPYLTGPEARGIDALHAAMIADLAGREADASRFYGLAVQGFGGPNLQLARVLASWQARHGKTAEARATLTALGGGGGDLAIVIPGLEHNLVKRPVASATDGMAEAYLAIAASLREQDSADFSVIMLRLALQLHSDLTPARLLLADVLDGKNQPAAALTVLAPISANDPLAALVDLRRAMLLDHVGKTAEALALLDSTAAQYPDRPEPLEVKGDVLRARQRWNEAIRAYDGAIVRLGQPRAGDWTLFYDRGIAYDQVQDWPKAEADFQTALRLAPDQPYVLNYLGYSWAVQGHHLSQARQMLGKAAELRPNDGAILDSLGYVMLRQGDAEGALHWLLRAVTHEPDDPTINGHLGDAYWAAGNKLAARYQWERALAMHPTASEAAELQSKLGAGYGHVGVVPAPHPPTAETHTP